MFSIQHFLTASCVPLSRDVIFKTNHSHHSVRFSQENNYYNYVIMSNCFVSKGIGLRPEYEYETEDERGRTCNTKLSLINTNTEVKISGDAYAYDSVNEESVYYDVINQTETVKLENGARI